jgi:hypothetical protein
LSAEKPGLFGKITARSEAQCLRLSDIYALLDCAPLLRVEHLKATLEAWRYCEDGARWSFRAGTGNKNADRILAALAAAEKKGLTKWQITSDVFSRNTPKHVIDEALRLLYRLKIAFREMEGTATKTAERWFFNCKSYEEYEEFPPRTPQTGNTSYSSYVSQSKNASSAESDTTPTDKPAATDSGGSVSDHDGLSEKSEPAIEEDSSGIGLPASPSPQLAKIPRQTDNSGDGDAPNSQKNEAPNGLVVVQQPDDQITPAKLEL